MNMLGILGGSGLNQLANLEVVRREIMRTPYGEPSGPLTFGRIGGHDVVFLARHGYGHTILPHEVNYRANVWALREAGVARLLAVTSVGGIRTDLTPGMLVLPNQIIDYTWGRASTYADAKNFQEWAAQHVDFTHPYCPYLRAATLAAAQSAGQTLIDGGVYATTQGPRLETAAEINRLERDGADIVGMTGMPEAALAKELGLSYASLSVIANYAAGRGASSAGISLADVSTVLKESMSRVRKILEVLVAQDSKTHGC